MPILDALKTNRAKNASDKGDSFFAKKKIKEDKKLKENISNEVLYQNLSEEDKRRYDIFMAKSKYNKYLSYGCLGLTMAIAVAHGIDIMDGALYDPSYGFADNLALLFASGLEYTFSNVVEAVIRIITIILPFEYSESFRAKSYANEDMAQEILSADRKSSMVDNFVHKLAKKHANKIANREPVLCNDTEEIVFNGELSK